MDPLIAYFSATGTTAKAAKALAEAVGGELYEIRPASPTPAPTSTGRTRAPAPAWR